MFLGLLDPDPLVRGTDPDPNATISREEHKSIYSGLKIIKMALSSQSDFKRIFLLSQIGTARAPEHLPGTYRDLPSPASQFAKFY
jgi:hypothetical protein